MTDHALRAITMLRRQPVAVAAAFGAVGFGTAILVAFSLAAAGALAAVLAATVTPLGNHPALATLIGLGTVAGPWIAVAMRRSVRDAAYVPAPTIEARSEATVRPAWLVRSLELLAVAAVVVLVMAPVLPHLSSRMLAGGTDAEFYLTVSHEVGHALRSGNLLPWRLHAFLYPHGLDLLLVDGLFGIAVTGMWGIIVGPVLAYNLGMASATVLNYLGGRFLAKQLTNDRLTLFATGAAVATAPVILNRYTGHLSLSFVFPVPIGIGLALGHRLRTRRLRVLPLAMTLVFCYLCSAYFLIATVALLAVILGFHALRTRGDGVVRSVALAVVVAGVVLSPFAIDRLMISRAEHAKGFDARRALAADYEFYSADATAAALPVVAPANPPLLRTPGLRHLYVQTLRTGEGYGFPGLLLVGGLGALVLVRTRARIALLTGTALVWLGTLGPAAYLFGQRVGPPGAWLPYGILERVPLVSGLRASGRFGLVLPAVLAPGLAIGLTRVRARIRTAPAKMVGLVVLGALLVANVQRLPTMPLEVQPGPARRALESLDGLAGRGDTLLPVPFCDGIYQGTEGVLQVFTRVQAVGCQAQYLNTPWYSRFTDYRLSAGLASLRCTPQVLGYVPTAFGPDTPIDPSALAAMRKEFGVRFLAIDNVHLAEPTCATLRSQLAILLAQGHVIGADARWTIVDLDGGG